jgi:hypothetical protein
LRTAQGMQSIVLNTECNVEYSTRNEHTLLAMTHLVKKDAALLTTFDTRFNALLLAAPM